MSRRAILFCGLLLAAAAPAQTVTIGVFGLFHPRDLTVTPAGAPLLIDARGQQIAVETGAVRLRLTANGIAVLAGTSAWRTSRVRIHARDGGATDLLLAVPGKIRRQYRGTLEITSSASELTAVVAMDLELAVASAVAAESPPGAPLEALKAQAVATRSFYAAHASGHRDFDFCDTTHCQFLRQPPAENSPAMLATHQTSGIVLRYRGAVFAAMFSSSCGGRTKSLAELGLPARDYPYFAVDCPYCRTHAEHWTRAALPVHGERERLALNRQHGWSALPGTNYHVVDTADGPEIEGSGLGHGLGFCQRGASAMAAEGSSFREILAHYYPNAVVGGAPGAQ